MNDPPRHQPAADIESSPSIHKALAHPLRYAIVVEVSEREASSKELSETLGEPFPRVCEHVRALRNWGFIEVVRTTTETGGPQHFYRAVRRPVFDAAEWQKIPLRTRIRTTNKIVRTILRDLAASMRSGKFEMHPSRAVLRFSLTVDDEGFAEADESALRHLAELGRIEARSANRLAASGAHSFYVRTATLVFEAGPEGKTGHDVGLETPEPDLDKRRFPQE